VDPRHLLHKAPLLLHNRIHGGDDAGVLCHEGAQGTLRGNEISNNRTYAVVALHGGAPALRRNWLHGARQGGVLVDEGGGVDVEDNEIAANAKSGIMLRGSSDGARLRRNRIRDGRDAGVHALQGAAGDLEGNDIFGNAQARSRSRRPQPHGYLASVCCIDFRYISFPPRINLASISYPSRRRGSQSRVAPAPPSGTIASIRASARARYFSRAAWEYCVTIRFGETMRRGSR
jgi:hypothetical protein